MSKPVNRTTVDHAHAVWPDFWEVVPATDYDALAQRCRELEEERDRQARLVGREICRAGLITKERDALRAEVERLRGLLKECRPAVVREVEKWTRYSNVSIACDAALEPSLLQRIDAAIGQQVKP